MAEINKAYLSEFILKYMNEHSLSLLQFSKESGISKYSLSRCIHNQSFLSDDNLKKLAEYTNTKISVILGIDNRLVTEADKAFINTNDLVLKLIEVLEGDQKNEE